MEQTNPIRLLFCLDEDVATAGTPRGICCTVPGKTREPALSDSGSGLMFARLKLLETISPAFGRGSMAEELGGP